MSKREYTAESDRMETLEAEVKILRANLWATALELDAARARLKWYKKLVAKLMGGKKHGKGNRPID